MLCARQGIPLRGHRDESTSDTLNKGNFQAVVAFRGELDQRLDDHLQHGKRNVTMVPKTIQNDLLEHMGKNIVRKTVEDVQASPFFAVIADEVSDVSNWEQLGIAIRYIRNNCAVEKLVVSSQVKIDGKSIYEALCMELLIFFLARSL